MIYNLEKLDQAIMTYVGARSEVTSQQKLPTEDEIWSSIELIGFAVSPFVVKTALQLLTATGHLFAYGPRYSTRPVG